MSFLYPRISTITRPAVTTGKGALPYQGLNPVNETVIASNVPCSIQQSQNTRKPDASLPGDITRGTMWDIFYPTLANGTIKDRDIITDEQGVRYHVTAAYWNSMGYKALCERLEA